MSEKSCREFYAMKTLYVSDLDGTLLRSDVSTSDYTNRTINCLAQQGMLFSYATARSYSTSAKVTRGLDAHIPLIVYNVAMIVDNVTGEILLSNFFGGDAHEVLDGLLAHGVVPIVYAFVDGVERFSYVPARSSRGVLDFVVSRRGDRRDNPVNSTEDLYRGDIFYFACIGEEEKLEPLERKYRDVYHTVYQKDIYSGEQWLEIMTLAASKSNAIRQLREKLGCNRLVVFGDGKNDIDMFELADEGYAVSNAAPELKAVATAVIGSNDEDAVAHWLSEHAEIAEG